MTPYTIEKYREAIDAWRHACDELDQAHACLRDVEMQYVTARNGGNRMDAMQIYKMADALLKELEQILTEEE